MQGNWPMISLSISTNTLQSKLRHHHLSGNADSEKLRSSFKLSNYQVTKSGFRASSVWTQSLSSLRLYLQWLCPVRNLQCVPAPSLSEGMRWVWNPVFFAGSTLNMNLWKEWIKIWTTVVLTSCGVLKSSYPVFGLILGPWKSRIRPMDLDSRSGDTAHRSCMLWEEVRKLFCMVNSFPACLAFFAKQGYI